VLSGNYRSFSPVLWTSVLFADAGYGRNEFRAQALWLQKFRPVFRGELDGFGNDGSLCRLIKLRRRRRSAGHGDADLSEKLFLTGWRTDAEQAYGSIRGVDEGMRRIGRDVDRLSYFHIHFFAPKGECDLAIEEGKRLLEVVAMGRRSPAGWNVHVDQAITAIGIIA